MDLFFILYVKELLQKVKQCIPNGYPDDYKFVTTDLANLPVETVVKKKFRAEIKR